MNRMMKIVQALDEEQQYEYGFDLTGFTYEEEPESADVAAKAWNAMKLPIKPVVAKHRHYVWSRKGLEVVCANNPFDVKKRPGYCSYMGLRGNKKDVMAAVRVIKQTAKKHGGDVEDTSPGRLDFIGFED